MARIQFISVLLASLLCQATYAYIPPSQFIVKNIANKRKDIKAIRVKSIVSAMENDKVTPVHFTAVTHYSAQLGTLKSWAVGENGVRLYTRQRKGPLLPPVNALLFEVNLPELIRSLREVGIPIRTEDELKSMKDEEERRSAEVEHLARWGGAVAWVIGRKSSIGFGSGPDSQGSNPQLWIEKDTFSPMRLILPSNPGGITDLRFEGFKTYRGFPYPKTVLGYGKDGNSRLKDEVLEVAVNPRADEIEEAVEAGFTEAASSIPSEVKELIQSYYEAVR